MPDRSVVVRLRAEVDGFKRAMTDAANSTKKVGDETAKAGDRATTATERLIKSAQTNADVWKNTGKVMLGAGTVLAAGLVLAAKSSMDFEAQLSGVQAVSGATAGELGKLRDAALKAGADTVFSAKEAAQAEEELAKAGIGTADILGGALRGSLDLAAAGQLDLARSAEISGQAMKIFGLQGSDVSHIADVLSAGANKSAADVETLAQAMQQSGLVAAQTGLHLEDTVGILSAFADNALTGSDAGTSLKTMLQRLNPQSAQAAKLMEQLGLSAYDSQGNFVGLANYAGQLQQALGKMSPEARNAAMQVLFGSDAVRAANVLYKLGADGVREYTAAVDDNGAASRTAAIQMDNLKGDIEQLRGSIQTGLIQSGSAGNDALRSLAQGATSVVNAWTGLPEGVQKAGVYLTTASAAALLLGGTFARLVPKAVAANGALVKVGLTSEATAAKMTTAAKGAGALAAAVAGVYVAGKTMDALLGVQAAGLNEAGQSLLAYSKHGKDAEGTTGLMSRGFKNLNNTVDYGLQSGMWAKTKEFFSDLGTLSIMPTGHDEAVQFFKELDNGLANLVESGHADEARKIFGQISAEATAQGISLARVKDALPQYVAAVVEAGPAAETTAGSMNVLGGKIGEVASAGDDAGISLKDLDASLKALFDQTFSVAEATDAWQSSLNGLTKAAKDNGKSLKGTSDGAIANRDALRELGTKAADIIQKMSEQGASYDDVVAKSKDLKAEFLDQAKKAGFSGDEVKKLADYLDSLPGTYQANVKVDGAEAARQHVKDIQAAVDSLRDRTVHVTIQERGVRNKLAAQIASGAGFADGGFINVGTGPRSDDVFVRASKGEFIMNAASTAQHRPLLERLNSRKFADGGYVTAAREFTPVTTSMTPVSQLSPSVTVTLPTQQGTGVQVVALRQSDIQMLARLVGGAAAGGITDAGRGVQGRRRNEVAS